MSEEQAIIDAKDALLTTARNALGGKEVLVDPSNYLMHVAYDDVQGIAPRGVIVFSNGDDEFFSHESAVAPSQRSRGLYRNAVIGAEHLKLMESISSHIPELGGGASHPLNPNGASVSSHTSDSSDAHHHGPTFVGGGVSPVIHSKVDDALYGNMGIKWQCVEFARRWLLMTRGVWMRSIPTAQQIWSLNEVVHVRSGNKVKLTKYENGKSCEPPRAGDLIIYHRAHDIPFGHVGAIVEVGADFVRIAEQNQEFVSYKSLEKLAEAHKEELKKARHAGSHAQHAHKQSTTPPTHHIQTHAAHTQLLPDDSSQHPSAPLYLSGNANDGHGTEATSAIRSGRHFGRQMPLRLDYGMATSFDPRPTVEIIDEDPVIGWVRVECPLLDFHEDDIADTFRHILTLGTIERTPLPGLDNPLVSLPWLDTTLPTDFFLKKSLIPAQANMKDGKASPADVPDAYYRMNYDFYMRIRNAAQSLHRLAIDATWKVVHSADSTNILKQFFNIPEDLHNHLRKSLVKEPPLGGRFDFGYDGERIIMMEYNCDSSAALLECCDTQEKMLNCYDLLNEEKHDPANHGTSDSSANSSESRHRRVNSNNDDTVSNSSHQSEQKNSNKAIVQAGVPPSRIPPSLSTTGSFLHSKYRSYFRFMREGPQASALCPANNTIHFMVDDDDEERYTALVAMGCAEAEGFNVKMCIKLTDFMFSPSGQGHNGQQGISSKQAISASSDPKQKLFDVFKNTFGKKEQIAADQAASATIVDENEISGLGSCSKKIFDLEGLEVQLVWKTWSWDTVLTDHRKNIAAKALAAANAANSNNGSITSAPTTTDGTVLPASTADQASQHPRRPRLCEILINDNIRVIEPFWKTVTGSKAILPIMYSLNPTHDNMVCSYFEANDLVKCGPYLSKPVSGRAGQNVTFFDADPQLSEPATRDKLRRLRVEVAKRQAQNPSELFEAGLKSFSSLASNPLAQADESSLGATPQPIFGATPPSHKELINSGSAMDAAHGNTSDNEVDEDLEASEGRFHDSLMIFQRRIILKGFHGTEDLLRRAKPTTPPPAAASSPDTPAVAAHTAEGPASESVKKPSRVYPIFCAWMIDDHFGGIVVREDDSKITKLSSKVMPCIVVRS